MWCPGWNGLVCFAAGVFANLRQLCRDPRKLQRCRKSLAFQYQAKALGNWSGSKVLELSSECLCDGQMSGKVQRWSPPLGLSILILDCQGWRVQGRRTSANLTAENQRWFVWVWDDVSGFRVFVCVCACIVVVFCAHLGRFGPGFFLGRCQGQRPLRTKKSRL